MVNLESELYGKISDIREDDLRKLLIKLNRYSKYFRFSERENSNGETIFDLIEQAINHLKEADKLLEEISF